MWLLDFDDNYKSTELIIKGKNLADIADKLCRELFKGNKGAKEFRFEYNISQTDTISKKLELYPDEIREILEKHKTDGHYAVGDSETVVPVYPPLIIKAVTDDGINDIIYETERYDDMREKLVYKMAELKEKIKGWEVTGFLSNLISNKTRNKITEKLKKCIYTINEINKEPYYVIIKKYSLIQKEAPASNNIASSSIIP